MPVDKTARDVTEKLKQQSKPYNCHYIVASDTRELVVIASEPSDSEVRRRTAKYF